MPASSRTITRSVAITLILAALITAWQTTRRREEPGSLPTAGIQRPGQASAGVASAGDQAHTDPPPVLPGKTHTRPSATELEQKRYERMKAEMTARREELKAAGMGTAHPDMRSVERQLEELEANHAGKSQPGR